MQVTKSGYSAEVEIDDHDVFEAASDCDAVIARAWKQLEARPDEVEFLAMVVSMMKAWVDVRRNDPDGQGDGPLADPRDAATIIEFVRRNPGSSEAEIVAWGDATCHGSPLSAFVDLFDNGDIVHDADQNYVVGEK